jgi:uncharacterized membrane protein
MYSNGLVRALVYSNALSLGLLLGRMLITQSTLFIFMATNLTLAWISFGLAHVLTRFRSQLSGGQRIWFAILLVAWLGFLPNSFYIITDFIHVRPRGDINQLYDVLMMTSFAFNGFIAGLASMFVVHKLLIRRFGSLLAARFIAVSAFASGFAIYLGRYLRWNTWDVVVNPFGLLFDVSDRLVNPGDHPQAFVTTITFALFIGVSYLLFWRATKALSSGKN